MNIYFLVHVNLHKYLLQESRDRIEEPEQVDRKLGIASGLHSQAVSGLLLLERRGLSVVGRLPLLEGRGPRAAGGLPVPEGRGPRAVGRLLLSMGESLELWGTTTARGRVP